MKDNQRQVFHCIIKVITRAFPDLDPEDIREALHYAAEAVRERELPLRNIG